MYNAKEEFSHLEIVGATTQLLHTSVNGELKNAADESDLTKMLNDKAPNENYTRDALFNSHFFLVRCRRQTFTDSNGISWPSTYMKGMVNLTVDMRNNIAAESTAKSVQENLMKFTDDCAQKRVQEFNKQLNSEISAEVNEAIRPKNGHLICELISDNLEFETTT